MSARRIARELAVIVFPQLPRDRDKLEKIELNLLVAKAVQMLVDYAKNSLADADALRERLAQKLVGLEVEHENNQANIEELVAVPVNTADLKSQLELIERAITLVSEALDIPEMALLGGHVTIKTMCSKCSHVNEKHIEIADGQEVREFLYRLVGTYVEHRRQIDQFIQHAKAKWKVERMVSIDRDILRLACAEAFYLKDIPLKVCINEAIELSHRFADDKAAKFINGVLRDLFVEAEHFRKTGDFVDRHTQSEGTEDEALTGSLPA